MKTENQSADQARAIKEDYERRPVQRDETPREARYRVQREQAQAEAKRKPHQGY